MDISKLFSILSAFLLLICMTFSITALVVLRNTVNETDVWLDAAGKLLADLNASVERLKDYDPSISVSADADKEETDVDILYHRFTIRETGGKIGVYTPEGYLIRTIEIDVSTLPRTEREALIAGITVDSWKELFERIQDYES